MKFTVLIPTIALLFCASRLPASAVNPVEVGSVQWTRDLDAALAKSAQTKNPVFAFFQEVPGCAGCQKFGAEGLTHPRLVEAIENEFVPVLIYNNQPDNDAAILQRFGEPAWNFQVVRFLDAGGKDLIPRQDRVWTLDALAARMIAALQEAKRPVPGYLRTVAAESAPADKLGTAAFAMSCFWTGEMNLGRIDGVTQTEAGWLDGGEVTLVRFDPAVLSFADLVKKAGRIGCADKVYAATNADHKTAKALGNLDVATLGSGYRAASGSDQKKQLDGTPFAKLQLSPMQATKVNAFARADPKRALEWLTPSQRRKLDFLLSH